MATVNLELKHYQVEALRKLRTYLTKTQNLGARTAFIVETNLPYREAPLLDPDVPYVCLRIPTGGGKTIMAAHAVGIAAKDYLQAQNPMVLWLVPSTAILNQTLNALKDLEHPYRAALAEYFGRNLSIMSLAEALSMPRPDAEGDACVVVSTLQSFRVEDKEGRKVYEDAGNLMGHFSGLQPEQLASLEMVEGTSRPVASLANVLRLHRPMVIVDEAHNVRTPLSFETLNRLNPSLVLELSATPETNHDPEKEKYASNILYHVSAAELKAEEMIKLPVRLKTESDWRITVGNALDCLNALDEAARDEETETGEYIRPILLFQAQSASKTDPHRLVPDQVKKFLVEDKRLPESAIAIHGAGKSELDGINVLSRDCLIRYVITVQKLREGWDCPFAYVLCSVAELKSKTAVEQLLGRVLRMPKARRKRRDVLNRAYAFVASSDFQATATALKDGLVEGAGFDRMEADELVKPQTELGFAEESADFKHTSDSLLKASNASEHDVCEALTRLPAHLRARVQFDEKAGTLEVTRALTRDDRNAMQLAFTKVPGAERVIERLFIRSNRIQASELPEGVERPPFIVPMLGFWKQDELELFRQEHFLDLPWNLAECDPTAVADKFVIRDTSKEGEIDVSEEGKIEIAFSKNLHDQLAMAVHEPEWTLARLVNWIDKGIPHRDVTKPAAKIFIQNALEQVMGQRDHSLDMLARYKYDLRRVVADVIDGLRREREKGNYDALFAVNAESFETSADLAIIFDDQTYAYNQPYKGRTILQKHYFQIVGDLKPEGEEFECAAYLDRLEEVRFWVRNVDRKPNSFWLQLPFGKFYPDFVALLKDSRILVVEYKGADRVDDEDSTVKAKIGNLWAEASNGTCLFVMPTNREFSTIDDRIEAGVDR